MHVAADGCASWNLYRHRHKPRGSQPDRGVPTSLVSCAANMTANRSLLGVPFGQHVNVGSILLGEVSTVDAGVRSPRRYGPLAPEGSFLRRSPSMPP